MRTVHGLKAAEEALCQGRRLDLGSVPPHVQRKTTEVFGEPLSPVQVVSLILQRVRDEGDEAVRDLTSKLEGVDLDSFEVPTAAVADAYKRVAPGLVDALKLAASRIRRFHEACLPRSWMDFAEGYGQLIGPVERVGAYVPVGLASTVLMTAVPARVAGVRQVVVATPGADGGLPHPAVLVAADIAGVDSVLRIGGAQAIAAMAYGTATVPRVDMVCGPGNVFVTLAKKLLYGEVGIDGLYGPTETMVIADGDANPTLCAADLLAQAEHDALATPILITTSQDVADAVQRKVEVRAERLDRAAIAKASLDQQGYIVVLDDLTEALELASMFAPEHLSLMVRDPWRYVGRVHNAGGLFLGEHSHEVLGDYVAGPSHVMPTGGTARFGSGLGVWSFLKVSPVVGLERTAAGALTEAASLIARAEGLTGHAEAAEIRDELPGQP